MTVIIVTFAATLAAGMAAAYWLGKGEARAEERRRAHTLTYRSGRIWQDDDLSGLGHGGTVA